MSRPTATAAQLLATHREVWWEFDVLTDEVRCDCRRDLKAGEPIVSRVQRRRGPKASKFDGIAVGDIMCVPCGTKAVQEWARIAADLEWRAEREALSKPTVAEAVERMAEAARRATERALGSDISGYFRPITIPCKVSVAVQPGQAVYFESTITLDGDELSPRSAIEPLREELAAGSDGAL